MTKTANISKENEIAFIALSNPPMNALSQGVRANLKKGVEDALNDNAIKAIVIPVSYTHLTLPTTPYV